MAETEYSTSTQLPVETVWAFVSEMDHWAPMLTGYQGHEKQSQTDSVWTLKGDVGILQRTVQFRVHVTDWSGPERVAFELEGVNEALEGEGEFRLATADAAPDAAVPRSGPMVRLVAWVLRFFHGLVYGRVAREAGPERSPGAGGARLSFRLRIDPGGPMAPMVNKLMEPAMLVAAEALSRRIIAHLEGKDAPGTNQA
ncbi:MAG: SRPBCC family protein [Myxococcota bacterium]|nr:SRPBCC family protein [Myxococcota bacterium]